MTHPIVKTKTDIIDIRRPSIFVSLFKNETHSPFETPASNKRLYKNLLFNDANSQNKRSFPPKSVTETP